MARTTSNDGKDLLFIKACMQNSETKIAPDFGAVAAATGFAVGTCRNKFNRMMKELGGDKKGDVKDEAGGDGDKATTTKKRGGGPLKKEDASAKKIKVEAGDESELSSL